MFQLTVMKHLCEGASSRRKMNLAVENHNYDHLIVVPLNNKLLRRNAEKHLLLKWLAKKHRNNILPN